MWYSQIKVQTCGCHRFLKNNKQTLVQVMVWCLRQPEPMLMTIYYYIIIVIIIICRYMITIMIIIIIITIVTYIMYTYILYILSMQWLFWHDTQVFKCEWVSMSTLNVKLWWFANHQNMIITTPKLISDKLCFLPWALNNFVETEKSCKWLTNTEVSILIQWAVS